MNARTARLIKRVAFMKHLRDPSRLKQPLASVERDFKAAWNRTPRSQRHQSRQGLVAIFNALAKGPTP